MPRGERSGCAPLCTATDDENDPREQIAQAWRARARSPAGLPALRAIEEALEAMRCVAISGP